MATLDSDLDIVTFSKTRPLTVEDLRKYSAADLDPHTVQVGQVLCRDIKFSSQGQRNLATAFDSLPTNTRELVDFEVGYGASHVIHSILKSDEGFTLAAVVGSLAEYFHEDVIVDFLLLLCSQFKLPIAWRPLRRQWQRLVTVLYSVLATSPLGVLLTTIEASCGGMKAGSTPVNVENLLQAFKSLSDASEGQSSLKATVASGEAAWLTAVGEFLFSLRVNVLSDTGELLYGAGAPGQAEAVSIKLDNSPLADGIDGLTLSGSANISKQILGGRVQFESLFRTCFGKAFTTIPEELLAAFICCASIIVQGRLSSEKPDWLRGLLSQPPTSAGAGPGVGPADTLSAWFPELQRLSPRFRKYSKLSYTEAKTTYDETYHSLRRHCSCSWCTGAEGDSENPRSPEQCSVIIAEFLLGPSLILSRTFVAPRLLPKKEGCVQLLRRWSSFFAVHRTRDKDPSDIYLPHVGAFVSSTSGMIKLAAVVFGNSLSPEVEAQDNLMGITHGGLAILSTGQKDSDVMGQDVGGGHERRWKTAIQISSGWLCLFGHETKMETYEQVSGGPMFNELEALVAQKNNLEQLRQIFTWREGQVVTSMVWKGSRGEKDALQAGWVSS